MLGLLQGIYPAIQEKQLAPFTIFTGMTFTYHVCIIYLCEYL